MKSKLFIIVLLNLFVPVCFAKSLDVENNLFETNYTEYINEYTINISVPVAEEVANNVLFVLDGSTVSDSSWLNMKAAMVEFVNEILPYDISEKNINSVGMVTFGISGQVLIPFTNDKEKFISALPELSDDLLLGRPSSNNETGLRVAREYLNSLPEEQKKSAEHTIVIYMSDGAVNMSDKLSDYYKFSIDGSKYSNTLIIDFQETLLRTALIALDNDSTIRRLELFDEIILELRKIYSSKNNLTEIDMQTSIGDVIDDISDSEEYQELLLKSVKGFYEVIGYDFSRSYSAGDFENLILTKTFIEDENISAEFLDFFYVPMVTVNYDRVESSNRAVEEGLRLKELSTIYTVAYNSGTSLTLDYANKIMNPNFTGKGSYTSNVGNHFSTELYFSNINKISEAFSKLTSDINKVNYKSVVVSGYTSKWVDPMDINNDGIFDEKDIVVVTGYKDNIIPNIKVEKVTDDQFSSMDNINISSNSSGSIYKITWEVTEEFKSWDLFKISYKVKMDEQENGFEYGKMYNANESFELNYKVLEINAEGVEEEKDISVNLTSPIVKYDKKFENPNTIDYIYIFVFINFVSFFCFLLSLFNLYKMKANFDYL